MGCTAPHAPRGPVLGGLGTARDPATTRGAQCRGIVRVVGRAPDSRQADRPADALVFVGLHISTEQSSTALADAQFPPGSRHRLCRCSGDVDTTVHRIGSSPASLHLPCVGYTQPKPQTSLEFRQIRPVKPALLQDPLGLLTSGCSRRWTTLQGWPGVIHTYNLWLLNSSTPP